MGIDDDLEMNELEEPATATQETKVTQKALNKERKALRRRLKGSKKKGGTGSGRPKKFRSKFETAHRIEQEKIARDNLIIQKNLQKTRNGAGREDTVTWLTCASPGGGGPGGRGGWQRSLNRGCQRLGTKAGRARLLSAALSKTYGFLYRILSK